MRRLSIVDIANGASADVQSRRHDIALVYNGEIYNAPALRQELES